MSNVLPDLRPRPIWWCLTEKEQKALSDYQWKHFRKKLKIPGQPLPVLETPEEIDRLMRDNQEVAR